MSCTVEKSRVVSMSLKGTDKLLYEKLLKKLSDTPSGVPMPSTQNLKDEFNVGYGKLKRALDVLKVEGKIVVRPRQGIYVNRAETHGQSQKSVPRNINDTPLPWIHHDVAEIFFSIPSSHPELNMWQELVDLYNQSAPFTRIVIKDGADRPGETNAEDILYFSSKINVGKKGLI